MTGIIKAGVGGAVGLLASIGVWTAARSPAEAGAVVAAWQKGVAKEVTVLLSACRYGEIEPCG